MKFRTKIKATPAVNQIDYDSNVVLLGSCFSEHMEEKFDYFKFEPYSNPYGILFHPKAIEKSVIDCLTQKQYGIEDLYQYNDTWLSLDHHSSFDQRNPDEVLSGINKNLLDGYNALKMASHVIITLGTSWVYKWKDDNSIVGNCYKIPQKKFDKILLSSEQILGSLKNIVAQIQSVNQQASFIFTVSPVRHLKDGFIENTLSKALLHKAIHTLMKELPLSYFPAYEIMMDDLRDYRFYKSDLIHPNEMAVDYIWEIFKENWMSEATIELMAEVEEIQRSLSHRPFDPDSDMHQKFLNKLEQKVSSLKSRHPQIKFHKKRK